MHRLHAVPCVHVKTPLVVIHDLYVGRPLVRPTETGAPLSIDPNATLTDAVAAQRFQPVAPQCVKAPWRQGPERLCIGQQNQSVHCLIGIALKCCNAAPLKEGACLPVLEVPYRAHRP